MRAGGGATATIDAFLAAVEKVAAGERGQISEAAIEPVAELPTLESLPAAGGGAASFREVGSRPLSIASSTAFRRFALGFS